MLVENIAELARTMQQRLVSITGSLRADSYPFPRGDENISVSDYLLGEVPHGHTFPAGGDASSLNTEALGSIVDGAQGLCQRYYSLHLRVLGQLALLGEKVKAAVGLPLLPEPGEGVPSDA